MHLHVYSACAFENEFLQQVGLALILQTCIQDLFACFWGGTLVFLCGFVISLSPSLR
jgi:hypothetical protein